jgi:hypothetical protein
MYNEGKNIAEWLNNTDLINRSALCKKLKIDRANLDKYLKAGEIPAKYADDMKVILEGLRYINKRPIIMAEAIHFQKPIKIEGLNLDHLHPIEVNTKQKRLSGKDKALPLTTEHFKPNIEKIINNHHVIANPDRLPGESTIDFKIRCNGG